jgi:putative peptidoglycan lipid II flippase
MSRVILKKASQIAILSMVSRCLAFIREFLLIKFLGIGAQSDAFFMAFRVPNTMRKIFAEGALSSVLIPALVKADRESGNKGASRLTTLAFIVVESLLLLFCLWVFFYAEFVMTSLAPGFDIDQVIYSVAFLRLLVSFILFVSSTAVLAAALQSKGKFLIPAVAPAFLNLFYVTALLVCLKMGYSIDLFCICMVAASAFSFLIHLAVYLKNSFSFLLPDAQTWMLFKGLLVQFFPYIVSMSVVEINFLIDIRFSSYLPAGSLSLIRYAFRFIGIPLGVMAASFATVLLPHFARLGLEDRKDLSLHLFEAIKLIVWAMVPVMFLMGLFSLEIFETLYSAGPDMIEKIKMTQIIFLVFLSGLLFFSINRVLLNVFYALELPRVPFVVSVFSVFLNYFLNQSLIQYYGAAGIAAASVIAAGMQMFVYLFYLYTTLKLEFDSKQFIQFLCSCAAQWTTAFVIFFMAYRALHTLVSSLSIDIALLWFRFKTEFFLHSFGLWAWVGPIMLLFVLFLFYTRRRFGIKITFLDA